MATCRVACRHYSGRIEVVFVGVVDDPSQRTEAVLDGRRCGGNLAETIADVDDRPPSLKIRQQSKDIRFLRAARPAATMYVDQHGHGAAYVLRQIQVQRAVTVTGDVVCHVRKDLILVRQVSRKRRCLGVLSRCLPRCRQDRTQGDDGEASTSCVHRSSSLASALSKLPRGIPVKLRVSRPILSRSLLTICSVLYRFVGILPPFPTPEILPLRLGPFQGGRSGSATLRVRSHATGVAGRLSAASPRRTGNPSSAVRRVPQRA